MVNHGASAFFIWYNAHQSNGSMPPGFVLFEQVGEQQHQFAIFVTAPPDIDGSRWNDPGVFHFVFELGDYYIPFQGGDNPEGGNQWFCLIDIGRPAQHTCSSLLDTRCQPVGANNTGQRISRCFALGRSSDRGLYRCTGRRNDLAEHRCFQT